MALTTILFDLDGTLLPMDQDVFLGIYFKKLTVFFASRGYDPKLFAKALFAGVEAMLKNGSEKSNEEIFWESAAAVFGDGLLAEKDSFVSFYENVFDSINEEMPSRDPDAIRAVKELRQKGYRIVLATNPVFPSIATEKRIRWAGLEPSDFEYYTTYENSRRAKPNVEYYSDLLNNLGVRADECLMVGNDVRDDMVAEELGIKVFLLTNCLINKEEKDISRYAQGGFVELLEWLE